MRGRLDSSPRPLLSCETVAHAALGEPVKRSGAELLWHCPRPEHKDTHASLSINPRKNVWACFPCGASGTAWQLAAFLCGLDSGDKPAVSAWLRERGLLPKGQRKAKSERGPCVAEYVYAAPAGNLVARKRRYEPGADDRKKDFTWERFEDGEWSPGLAGIELPLYRAREIAGETTVILVEGEKDADAGARIGLPTLTAGGVNSFRADHAEFLHGKQVLIVADADEPGRRDALRVAGLLHGKAASIRVGEIPDCKDLAEAIERGWTRERLLALFDGAPKWKPADGAEILDAMIGFLGRFISMTPAQARATALWIIHTHALDAADSTPYLSINSAEKQSGKTRLLEVLALFVANPWFTGRVTAAVLVRKIDAVKPTLLLDESDAAFGGEEEYAQTLRGVLNTGYRRGGATSVCVGQGSAIDFKDFSTFSPKAIAGIGKLPDTISDRSLPVRLKRARRGAVARFRQREVECEAREIRSRIVSWCTANVEQLRQARPQIPIELSDRQADCCEPLLAIADLAGGDWARIGRTALVELCTEGQRSDESIGVRLLMDIRAIFSEIRDEEITSSALAEALAKIEVSPWGEWSHGKPITPAKIARLLKPFAVFPGQVLEGASRGYRKGDFEEAFLLYLPKESVEASEARVSIADPTLPQVSPTDTLQSVGTSQQDLFPDASTLSKPGNVCKRETERRDVLEF